MAISKPWSEAWQRGMADPSCRYHQLVSQWAHLKRAGNAGRMFAGLADQSFAIFGLGTLGLILFDELAEADFSPAWIIENRPELAGGRFQGIDVIQTQLLWCNPVDVVIVTPVFAYPQICQEIMGYRPAVETINLATLIHGTN